MKYVPIKEPKVRFYPMVDFETGEQIGELKYDPFRENRRWTALLTNHGTFGGVEFFPRVGDFYTSAEAEKALRKAEERRKALVNSQ